MPFHVSVRTGVKNFFRLNDPVVHKRAPSGSENYLIFLTMSEMNTTGQPFPMVDGWPVLNPLAPSVFLPPEVAYQVEISKYILIGTLGVSFSSQLSRV